MIPNKCGEYCWGPFIKKYRSEHSVALIRLRCVWGGTDGPTIVLMASSPGDQPFSPTSINIFYFLAFFANLSWWPVHLVRMIIIRVPKVQKASAAVVFQQQANQYLWSKSNQMRNKIKISSSSRIKISSSSSREESSSSNNFLQEEDQSTLSPSRGTGSSTMQVLMFGDGWGNSFVFLAFSFGFWECIFPFLFYKHQRSVFQWI